MQEVMGRFRGRVVEDPDVLSNGNEDRQPTLTRGVGSLSLILVRYKTLDIWHFIIQCNGNTGEAKGP